MGLTRSEHEVLERGGCQQRRLERNQMAWGGGKVRTPGLCSHVVCCWGDGGGCILRLQQAVIWDAQTDADWINETGKQPPAEGSLHVRLLFCRNKEWRLRCVICLPCLWHRMFSRLMRRRTAHRNRFRTHMLQDFPRVRSGHLQSGFLWVVYLVASVCCVLGWAGGLSHEYWCTNRCRQTSSTT